MTKHKEEKKEKETVEPKEAEAKAEESAEVQNLADKYLDGWKRAQADFENYKKRQTQSAQEFAKYANLDLIMQILPVLDNFQAATAHIPEDQKDGAWVAGIMHIQKQLEKVLEDNGVAEIAAKVGDDFDPNLHEAVQDNSNDSDAISNEANKIKKVFLKGYKIDGKVIRAVRVIVE